VELSPTSHSGCSISDVPLHSSPGQQSASPRDKTTHASWDDVNVVAHGLLQLGQGLKEHVDKTKAQMRDVTGKLKAFNSTVAELERNWWRKSSSNKTSWRNRVCTYKPCRARWVEDERSVQPSPANVSGPNLLALLCRLHTRE
uniref:Uncharacterized protein n=1 Tax=Oryzias latipes TaxID=8090 RepID=A0A3B3HP99_ORYLA